MFQKGTGEHLGKMQKGSARGVEIVKCSTCSGTSKLP